MLDNNHQASKCEAAWKLYSKCLPSPSFRTKKKNSRLAESLDKAPSTERFD